MGHGAVVGVGQNVHGALFHNGILNEGECGHIAGNLVGMGAAQDQHLAAFFFALQNVHRSVRVGVFHACEPVGEHFHLSDTGAPLGEGHIAGCQEAGRRGRHNGHGQRQADDRRDHLFRLIHSQQPSFT